MFYRIAEVSTDKASEHTYVLVDFWPSRAAFERGDAPVLTNDFLMQLKTTATRIVRNADGWLKTLDGDFIDPETLDPALPEPEMTRSEMAWEYETVDRNIPAEMKTNIEAYWKRAESAKLTGDHTADATKPLLKDGALVVQGTSPPIERDQSDPTGVLAKQEVRDLVGVGIESEKAERL